jgi:hypothetical protein
LICLFSQSILAATVNLGSNALLMEDLPLAGLSGSGQRCTVGDHSSLWVQRDGREVGMVLSKPERTHR